MDAETGTIAIIGGTGAEGSALALRLGHANYRVIIGTRDASRGARTCEELNGILGRAALQSATNAEAARAAEVIILTVPYNAQISTVTELRAALDGKILIDATVPLQPPKVSSVQLPAGGSAVAAVQQMLGNKVRVVSAFQNVAAHKLRQLGADVGCDVFVCGDDAEARAVALALIAKMGLRGLDAGPICNSAAAEALTSILIFLNRKHKVAGSGVRITGLDEAAAPR
jgi:8-hydroxy-5-deazaflavin:NADPH oxidoreductase